MGYCGIDVPSYTAAAKLHRKVVRSLFVRLRDRSPKTGSTDCKLTPHITHMSGYDFNRPFVSNATLPEYEATDAEVAKRYGRKVRATDMSNSEYGARYARLAKANNMKPPPSHGRIFAGYLVVRRLNTQEQYETWIPDHAFEEIYAPIGSSDQ